MYDPEFEIKSLVGRTGHLHSVRQGCDALRLVIGLRALGRGVSMRAAIHVCSCETRRREKGGGRNAKDRKF
jgi:hypothetical protein